MIIIALVLIAATAMSFAPKRQVTLDEVKVASSHLPRIVAVVDNVTIAITGGALLES